MNEIIVIKISSNLLNPEKKECTTFLENLTKEISLITNQYKIIIVTSGAVLHGIKTLGFNKKPKTLPLLQSCAAIGQIKLMQKYQTLFDKYNIKIAQILVSSDDFRVRNRYLNLRNITEALLELNAIPIFNENDSINIEELKVGDNDNLSAMISLMVNAKLLILLTDVDGFYNKDPKLYKDAKLIDKIKDLTPEYLKMTGEAGSPYSTGGMKSKIEAALKATNSGIDVFIGNGFKTSLIKILKNEERGTYIDGKQKKLKARKRWLAFSPAIPSEIHIDKGAYSALLNNSSLLASGIIEVKGNFQKGSLVNIIYEGKKIAQGLTNYSSEEIKKIKGKKSSEFVEILGSCDYEEVIHKDNLFLNN